MSHVEEFGRKGKGNDGLARGCDMPEDRRCCCHGVRSAVVDRKIPESKALKVRLASRLSIVEISEKDEEQSSQTSTLLLFSSTPHRAAGANE